VFDATQGAQVPWVEEAVLGDFFFAPGEREAAPVVASATRPFDIPDADAIFWRTVEEMSTEAQRRAGLNLYLQVFPEGEFQSLARQQLVAFEADRPVVTANAGLPGVAAPGAGAFTDLLLWESVRQSDVPADIESYLDAFPSGIFAGLAAEKLAALRAGETQVAALDTSSIVRTLRIPYGIKQQPLTFRSDEAARALEPGLVARVDALPFAGEVLIGGRPGEVGAALLSGDLDDTVYQPAQGVTGPLGEFAVAVESAGGAEIVLSSNIEVHFDEAPVREVAATAGVGPVPMTIPLPPSAAGQPTELVIDALPHGARLLAEDRELGLDDRIQVASVAELAIAVPGDATGDLGEIVYSFAPATRAALPTDADGRLRESITVAGLAPDYDVQDDRDSYIGVGPRPLTVALPDDLSTKLLIEEIPFGELRLPDGRELAIGDYLDAANLQGLTFEPHRHVTGPVGQLVYSYQGGDDQRLVRAIGIDAAIHDCDLLASDPFDEDRVSDGTYLWRLRGDGRKAETYLDGAAAILACLSASEQFPDVTRFKNLLVRAYIVAEDFENAREWLEPMAAAGDPKALSGLGLLYSKGWAVEQDYKRAFDYFYRSAELGYTAAAHEVGKAYRDGLGVPQDYAEAARWIKVAADIGFSWAQNNLGLLYAGGLGVPRDYAEAARWFQAAADQDLGWAKLELANLYRDGKGVPQSPERALSLYRDAQADGIEWADIQMAQMYQNGIGVPQDDAKAAALLESATERDNPLARARFASLLLEGKGLPADPERAVALLEDAGAEGDASALTALGAEYESGQYLPVDKQRAYALYSEAAAGGDPGGQSRLANLLRKGDGVPQDPVEARRLYGEASAAGNLWATFWLATMELNGDGGAADPDAALARLGLVLKRSNDQNLNREAERALGRIPADTITRAVQSWLQREGLDPGPADGVAGSRTRTAIEQFERARGLPASGRMSPALIAALAPS
jgi:TPR repeat protein/peptidoglycan hydrolase-like protein with peptidoglycan-binding domain